MLPTGMELRIALRTLRRSKAFATFSVLALALAIAANTTMSSLIDGLIHPNLDFPDPGQLVIAHFTAPKSTLWPRVNIRQVLGDSGRTYAGVGGWFSEQAYGTTVSIGLTQYDASISDVPGNLFHVIGTRPLYGTLFYDSTAVDRHEVVISDRLWREIKGDHASFAPFSLRLSGYVMRLSSSDFVTVIGVIADNAALPLRTDIFLPNAYWTGGEALIRLRRGVSRETALLELNALAPNLDPNHSRFAHFVLRSAQESPARQYGVLGALSAATLAVLLIACANIANLLLARGMSRSRELATRLAFGASKRQVARLLFAESGLVAGAGGAAGLLLALWSIHLVRATLPSGLQFLGLVEPQISWRVIAAGVGLTMVAAIVFGLAPAFLLTRADINTLLKGSGGRHSTGNRTRFQLLVVAEVAGALTLVVSASLLGAAAGKIHFIDLGYNATNLISAQVREVPPGTRVTYNQPPTPAVIAKRYGELQALREMPGVAAVTASWGSGLYGEMRVDDPGGGEPRVFIGQINVNEVNPDFLRVKGVAVLHGRDFNASEDDPIPSVIIDERAAQRLWPGADPLGRLIQFKNNGQRKVPWMRVVGIARNTVSGMWCDNGPCASPTFYIANGAGFPAPISSTSFIVRTTGSPSAFIDRLRLRLAADYPGEVPSVSTWADAIGMTELAQLYDFITALFGSFTFVGLLLALIGVYGMAAYSVELRAREFGVRIALGAQTRDIVRLVLREGNATALLGLAIGLVTADWAEGLLSNMLFGYDSAALYFMAGAMVALFAATVLAGVPPALRAARVNPVDTLRSE